MKQSTKCSLVFPCLLTHFFVFFRGFSAGEGGAGCCCLFMVVAPSKTEMFDKVILYEKEGKKETNKNQRKSVITAQMGTVCF